MRLYALLLGGILGLTLSGAALAGPFLPGAKGLTRVEPGLWIDRAAPADRQAQIRALIAQARADAALDLAPRGLTWHDRVIQVGSRAADDGRFYLHETVHAELHNAAGLIGLANAALPNWLNEGAAVLIARMPGFPEGPDRCANVAGTPPPQTRTQFNRLAGPKGKTARLRAGEVIRQPE